MAQVTVREQIEKQLVEGTQEIGQFEVGHFVTGVHYAAWHDGFAHATLRGYDDTIISVRLTDDRTDVVLLRQDVDNWTIDAEWQDLSENP